MIWSLLLCILALLLYILGSIKPLLCLICALFGLFYFAYEFMQVLTLSRQAEALKRTHSFTSLRPFAHVGGADLLQGQNCFLALDGHDQLVLLAENYQESLPIQHIDRILDLHKQQVKSFIHQLQRLLDQMPQASLSKAYHLFCALQPVANQAWNGLLLLEVGEEQGTRMLIFRPLWATRSRELLAQEPLLSLLCKPDDLLAELALELDLQKVASLSNLAGDQTVSLGPGSTKSRHILKKADLDKPAHVDKEDYYES